MATRTSMVLMLRLAGPLQSWGDRSVFNRRETRPQPTKSGVLGLLAAAQGRPREAPLDDLLELRLGVRIDQPGSLLRDYHTVSDYRGRPLPQAGVTAKGVQKQTGPAKHTHVTQRFYLQDAVFVVAVAGPPGLVRALDDAVRRPAFPLALGRRACPPTQPVRLPPHTGDLTDALSSVRWQASERVRETHRHRACRPADVYLSVTVDDPTGTEVLDDVPLSFHPRDRRFTSRRVRHAWLSVPTGFTNPGPHLHVHPHPVPDRDPDRGTGLGPGVSGDGTGDEGHDPFALLGW